MLLADEHKQYRYYARLKAKSYPAKKIQPKPLGPLGAAHCLLFHTGGQLPRKRLTENPACKVLGAPQYGYKVSIVATPTTWERDFEFYERHGRYRYLVVHRETSLYTSSYVTYAKGCTRVPDAKRVLHCWIKCFFINLCVKAWSVCERYRLCVSI